MQQIESAPGVQAHALAAIVPQMARNMRFVGWFYLIYGGLVSLTIIGAIFGVPLLIGGLRLREAADEFEAFRATGNFDAIVRGFERQDRFFFILKVFVILSLLLLVIYLIVVIGLVTGGLLGGGGDYLNA